MYKSFTDNLEPLTLSKSLFYDVVEAIENLESGQDEKGLNILLKLESDMETLIAMAE